MTNEFKEIENIYRLQFLQNPQTCFKIFEYISLYANNMQIIDIHRIEKTNDDLSIINYFVILIKADQACFRKLNNYLEE